MERRVTDEMSTAFIVRLTWENLAKNWRIQFTPVNGDDPKLFCDAESLFLYIEQMMDRSEREPQDSESPALSQQSTWRV
jgi:hypothetical protein